MKKILDKNSILSVRFTSPEKDWLQRQAKKAKQRLSDYVRSQLLPK
jgi:hypothetical protein